MASISERTEIPSPLHQVWPLLSDPATVAACIPGAQLAPDQGDGLWRGSIRVKFGPTVAVFRGEATLDFDHDAKRCTIEGRGIDQRGASRALASGVMTASGGATTVLAVDGSFSVSGPLETFANAGGVHVARALLAEFSGNMARVVAERRGAQTAPPAAAADGGAPAAAPPAAPAPMAGELSGFRVLWRAFLSWLRGVFDKKRT